MASKLKMKRQYWHEMYENSFAMFEILSDEEKEVYSGVDDDDLPDDIVPIGEGTRSLYKYTLLLPPEQIEHLIKLKTDKNIKSIKMYISIAFWLFLILEIISMFLR